MKLERQLRLLLVLCAMLMALGPVSSAFAGTAAEEAANREARCKLVLSGAKISGNLRFDECTKYAAAAPAGDVRALQNAPVTVAKCPHPGKPLTKLEGADINAYAIAKRKAHKKNLPDPKPSDEVLALMACS